MIQIEKNINVILRLLDVGKQHSGSLQCNNYYYIIYH